MAYIQPCEVKIRTIAYHRNGVCGNGFHVVLFDYKQGRHWLRMCATVFEELGSIAVLDLNLTNKGNVAFANGNSWRGDHYEPVIRKAIAEWNEAENKKVLEELGATNEPTTIREGT